MAMEYDDNNPVSGNAYKGRLLKRMEIAYGDIDIKFAVNPEDYTQKEPNMATITNTKGGAWIDAWGAGITEITIKGITGVKGTGGKDVDTGYKRWKELRNLFRSVYAAVTDGQEITELIRFYNFTDNEFFYCYPSQAGIELYRSKSRPHIYQYTINLWVIRKIGDPQPDSGSGSTEKQVIGNPLKTYMNAARSGSAKITSKNVIMSVLGGDTYKAARISDTEADTITVTNTKTKTLAIIQEDCRNYYTQLEPIIGGKEGKISPVTGFNCAQGVTIQPSGAVSNVEFFSGEDLAEGQDMLLHEVNYSNKVSPSTYIMYTKIQDYSPDVLSHLYSIPFGSEPRDRVIQAVANSRKYDSTIYEMINDYQTRAVLSKLEVKRLKVILLESMMVYQELYSMYNQSDGISTELGMTNMGILINNIRAMIMYFTFINTEVNKMERQNLIPELRKLEKIMTQASIDIVDYL